VEGVSSLGPLRVVLCGNVDGPVGWALQRGSGVPEPMTHAALLTLVEHLRVDGEAAVADDLGRQLDVLSRVAGRWRQQSSGQLVTADPGS
jgi:hypothetical protein